jgi:probable rRNA maturation factor
MTRDAVINNRHPRLKVPRAAVARMIALLDAEFTILPGDLKFLSLPRGRVQNLRSQILRHGTATNGERVLRTHPGRRARRNGANLKSGGRQPAVPPGELSIAFLTDPALAKIHADFMDDPTATDVITFEGDTAAGLAGEICVSADTAARYVGLLESRAPARPRLGGSPTLQQSFATELALYVVHGWLHLAGYDDLQPAKKRRMRAAEARAMELLRARDAIPAFRLSR